MDYFTLFNLPKKFNINQKILSEKFYKLQTQFHPDLFIGDSTSKKKTILEKSIEINKGYKILKNFLTRAIYLLSLNGFEIEQETILSKNNNFLTKYFSLYEDLECLKKDNVHEARLNNFLKKIERKILKYQNEIEIAFEEKNFSKVTETVAKLLFFTKMKINIQKERNTYLR